MKYKVLEQTYYTTIKGDKYEFFFDLLRGNVSFAYRRVGGEYEDFYNDGRSFACLSELWRLMMEYLGYLKNEGIDTIKGFTCFPAPMPDEKISNAWHAKRTWLYDAMFKRKMNFHAELCVIGINAYWLFDSPMTINQFFKIQSK